MFSTAADMPGSFHITLIVGVLSSCDAFRLGSYQRVINLSPAVAHVFQDEASAQLHSVQELVITKRHSVQELVRAQPHLIHDMGWPEIHETSRSQAKMDSANFSQLYPTSSVSQDIARTHGAVDGNLDVEDEMERMVHLAVPQDAESYRELPGTTDLEKELLGGPGAGDESREASGFYGRDMEDRDRGEDRERRGGEDEWERDTGEDRERRGGDARGEDEERGGGTGDQDVHVLGALEANHTTPDLDALIGYRPTFHPSSSQQPSISSPADVHDSGLQEQPGSLVLEVGPLERELWEAAGEEDGHSSGYGVLQSAITTTSTTSTATPTLTATWGKAVGTATPETDRGTDFGLLGSYTKATRPPELFVGTKSIFDGSRVCVASSCVEQIDQTGSQAHKRHTADETEDEETEREEEEEETILAHNPTVPEVGMAPSREPLQPSVEEEEELEQEEHEFKRLSLKDRSEELEEEKWGKKKKEETRIRHIISVTTDLSTTISFTNPSWDWLEKTTPLPAQRSEVRGGGVTEVFLLDSDFDEMEEERQVMCLDWSELAGRGYVILNMTQNLSCEEFRVDQGVRLLKIMERVFARRMNSPEGSWVLYLSKPTHQQHQLLMNVASEHGVIGTKDVLSMLGEIRKSLNKVGIQNYSTASSCQSRPSQTRSDYGKLFVVLVIIGSVCMVIITSGFIYICWQRRLPATKTTFRAEELHFVENGCHDNPMLDVVNESQPDMQEKKPSTNGLSGEGEGGREDSNRWQVFVNQAVADEEDEEQDTHL